MGKIKDEITKMVVSEGLKYLEKDTEENKLKLIRWAERLAFVDNHKKVIAWIRDNISDPQSVPSQYVRRIFEETNLKCRQKLASNLVAQSYLIGRAQALENEKKYHCKIPWAILVDPTTACNLKCNGCWAAEYDKNAALSFKTLDSIITQGKELGIYTYLFSGGEPLIKKEELIKFAEKHDDCLFLAFTNGTFVDEAFAKELARVGNFTLAFSIEGFKDETDMRRGEGCFEEVLKAMDILRKEGVIFGFSTCYHSKNYEVVSSDEYLDLMQEKGCLYGWYFTYMPLGKNASLDLLCSPDQREHMYHKIRESRSKRPMFLLDFWNDGEYVEGCVAGGRCYFHINANGDVEPCAFIHYSNVNIHDVSLVQALQCDLFKEFQKQQPFNINDLMPCPLLDNPQKLKEMVFASNAKSTQPLDEESVVFLTNKCKMASKRWEKHARRLWEKTHKTILK